MITTATNDNCYEFRGLSSDTKPIEKTPSGAKISNGAIFVEMDTCKVFFYDAANKQWLEAK